MNVHSNQNCTISYHLNKKSTTIYIFFSVFFFVCYVLNTDKRKESVLFGTRRLATEKNKARKSELCMCVCVQERINIIYSAARNIRLKYHAVNAVKENMVNSMNYNKSKHKSMVTIKSFPPILQ